MDEHNDEHDHVELETSMPNPEQCWNAVLARDNARDGQFYFGVLTTGVYCRPACPARTPLRQNVRFYATPADAEQDGLRPCLRCRPLEPPTADRNAVNVAELCRYIETNLDSALTLKALGEHAQLSPSYLQRLFLSVTGVSPKQYAESCRMRKLKSELRNSADVAQAVYGAGFGSASRVYERADTRLGMTPGAYRKNGKGIVITYAPIHSELGLLLVGATDRGICFLQFGESLDDLVATLRKEYPAAIHEPMREPHAPEFARWVAALNVHLAGQGPLLELPLDVRSTAFQMKVWTYLQSIPSGHVQSYGEVATGIGQPKAARAVGHACATNPVALLIPCHRVISGGGDLGGYRWGLARKRTLLDQERARSADAATSVPA